MSMWKRGVCGRLFPWRRWRLSRGIGGQKGNQYGNGWRRWRFLTVEAVGERPGGRGCKIYQGNASQDHAPGFARALSKLKILYTNAPPRVSPWAFFPPISAGGREKPTIPPPYFGRKRTGEFPADLFHLREWGYFARKRPYFGRSRKI